MEPGGEPVLARYRELARSRYGRAVIAGEPTYGKGTALTFQPDAGAGAPGLATVASLGLAQVMGVPYLFSPAVNLLSFVFSAGIGVVFGYFPARRAAHMDPIDALRHE